MQSVTFDVPGKPQGKARARTFRNKNTGNSVSVTPEHTVLYENLIKNQFLYYCGGVYFERGVPVTLRITARFLPAKSTSKRKSAQMLSGGLLPLGRPDMDNIVKAVADALNGAAYHDDTQVVYIDAKKIYSAKEGLDVTVEEYKLGG